MSWGTKNVRLSGASALNAWTSVSPLIVVAGNRVIPLFAAQACIPRPPRSLFYFRTRPLILYVVRCYCSLRSRSLSRARHGKREDESRQIFPFGGRTRCQLANPTGYYWVGRAWSATRRTYVSITDGCAMQQA